MTLQGSVEEWPVSNKDAGSRTCAFGTRSVVKVVEKLRKVTWSVHQ